MYLAQVEGFVEIARQGSMHRAADTLLISQPALSARIRALEEELGTSLFRRTSVGMELTHSGRAFLPHAERALESLESGATLVRELELGVKGELALGVAPAVSAYVLPDLLVHYGELYPAVRLLVRTGHSEEILELVVRGQVDLGVVREIRDPRVTSWPLYEDELVMVAQPGHPMTQGEGADVSRMRESQLILFDRTSSYFELTSSLFRVAGVVPRGVTEVDNIEAAKRIVERGLGVALLPGTAVAEALQAGTLVQLDLTGLPRIRRRICAVQRRGQSDPSPSVMGFVTLLHRIPDLIPLARRVGSSE